MNSQQFTTECESLLLLLCNLFCLKSLLQLCCSLLLVIVIMRPCDVDRYLVIIITYFFFSMNT